MVFVSKPEPKIFYCTKKQQEIMRLVLAAADKGEFLHLSGLNKLIYWGPTSASSLSMVVRHLEAHGFLKRLYGKAGETDVSRMLECNYGEHAKVNGMVMRIVPTPFAYSYFRPGSS